MATVPTGPSSALPASPAQIPPFPGAGSAESAGEDGEPACYREDSLSDGSGEESQPVTEVKRLAKRKPKNMLTRASPAALHLKMQAREQQQQLNGSASPPEAGDSPQHTGSRADNPRPSVENCDSGSEGTPSSRNNSERCQHEGHGPFTKNGSLPLLINNSMNGIPALPRTEAANSHPEDEGKEERDPAELQRPLPPELPDTAGAGGEDCLAELARLDLSGSAGGAEEDSGHGIRYVRYESELQMPWIMRLITKDLSEPYSIYTYRYFIHNWPQLCFLAMVEQECVGAIVCKLDMHKKMFRRGYIAMLAVDSKHRRKSIGTNLVKKAIYAMVEGDCDEVVLETEITNKSALKLYENLGFVRDKRLFRYYLNGVDALRLKLWLR
ncbi:N-alpha-acetyltransferase 30 [Genypterus blacodes]|uniref:N-alpha-acetyltransferase 30 n=1 Tax=Genypterus blacodes TaxID=154954 RepID=UPI003F77270A